MSTFTSTSTTHLQPRRRAARGIDQPNSTTTQPAQWSPSPKDLMVPKGSTFHAPKLPPSSAEDPVLNIKTLPSRTLTSPEALQQLCDESEKRVNDLLASFNGLSTAGSDLDTDYQHQDVLPVPGFLVAHAAAKSPLTGLDSQDQETSKLAATAEEEDANNHHHGSDSGLGTSIGTSVADDEPSPVDRRMSSTDRSCAVFANSTKAKKSVYRPLSTPTVVNPPAGGAPLSTTGHVLSDFAAKVIKLHIIDPLLEEPTLAEFHPLVKGLPQRIGSRKITCLRDLEKTLIFLAPVRAYARIMARSRSKKAKGQPLDDDDIHPSVVPLLSHDSSGNAVLTLARGDTIKFEGGVAEDGKPIEIVRERDGRIIAIDAGYNEIDEEMLDDDVRRSMARKRKCDIGKVEYRACRECGKVYTRPCDLTKHEKTHSRPWKCTEEDCKYFEMGWPTEKERDRHVNDKHSARPALYRCIYKPCAYTSKRESNCKQHMEKAHGWEYVRSKSKKGTKLVATQASPPTTLMPTPGSERLSTPASTSHSNQSPTASSYDNFSPAAESSHGGSISSYQQSNVFAPSPASDFDFNNYSNKGFSYDSYLSPQTSNGRRESSTSAAQVVTPASGQMPNLTFEDEFNFNNVNIDWSTMGHVFPQYSIPQQPTPAGSEFGLDFGYEGIKEKNIGAAYPDARVQEISPAHHSGDEALFAHSTEDLDVLMGDSQGFRDFAESRPVNNYHQNSSATGDFTLFGEVSGGEESANTAAAMFPDLGDVDIGGNFNSSLNAGMFDQMSDEEMDRYLYGDGN